MSLISLFIAGGLGYMTYQDRVAKSSFEDEKQTGIITAVDGFERPKYTPEGMIILRDREEQVAPKPTFKLQEALPALPEWQRGYRHGHVPSIDALRKKALLIQDVEYDVDDDPLKHFPSYFNPNINKYNQLDLGKRIDQKIDFDQQWKLKNWAHHRANVLVPQKLGLRPETTLFDDDLS